MRLVNKVARGEEVDDADTLSYLPEHPEIAFMLTDSLNLDVRFGRGEISLEELMILDNRNKLQHESSSSRPSHMLIKYYRRTIEENQERIRTGLLTFHNPKRDTNYTRRATKKEIEALKRKGLLNPVHLNIRDKSEFSWWS